MRFLHTADWHIGKQLYKYSLNEDLKLFFDHLISIITSENIDVLLMAGDVFDLANPSHADRTLYYQLLKQLSSVCKKVIITGGNHDSPSFLDAPAELLKALNIDIVGGVDSTHLENEIIPVYSDGILKTIVLAVPYLRDRDIRSFIEGQSHEDQLSAVRAGIKSHYSALVSKAREMYNAEVPIIGMGHLYLQGASLSESERDIKVGNLDGLDHKELMELMDYLALGHIHRPQKIDASGKILYSGSPIKLSFSERQDAKRFVIGDIQNQRIKLTSHPLPRWRDLVLLEGSYETICKKLEQVNTTNPLPTLVELHVIAEQYDPNLVASIDLMCEQYTEGDVLIIKRKITYENAPIKLSELLVAGHNIEDVDPLEVFKQYLDKQVLDDTERADVLEAYQDILRDVQESD